jgi:hypothetical protein
LAECPEEVFKHLESTFTSLLLRDEKVHLHVVEMSALSFLEGNEPVSSQPPGAKGG